MQQILVGRYRRRSRDQQGGSCRHGQPRLSRPVTRPRSISRTRKGQFIHPPALGPLAFGISCLNKGAARTVRDDIVRYPKSSTSSRRTRSLLVYGNRRRSRSGLASSDGTKCATASGSFAEGKANANFELAQQQTKCDRQAGGTLGAVGHARPRRALVPAAGLTQLVTSDGGRGNIFPGRWRLPIPAPQR